MKKLALMALAAGMVVGGTGIASAQYYDPAYRNYPRYRDYDRPRPYYRERYRERGDYEERRSYRRGRVLSARPIPNLERVPTGMDCSGRCLQTLSGILGRLSQEQHARGWLTPVLSGAAGS